MKSAGRRPVHAVVRRPYRGSHHAFQRPPVADHPTYGPLKTTGTPLKLSETPGRVRWLAPQPGEHNEEVFVGLLGYSRDDLARWQAEGVI